MITLLILAVCAFALAWWDTRQRLRRLQGENEELTYRVSEESSDALCKRERAEAAEARVRALQDGLREYDAWANRMPDAGFNSESSHWDWWHERLPISEKARALVADSEPT